MKLVRKLFIMLMAAVCITGFTASAFAEKGGGGPMRGEEFHGNGQKNTPSQPVSILEGEPVIVSGTVHSVGQMRRGIDIETNESTVTVYGFGPVGFWEDAGFAYPAEGDTVMINGYEVTFSDDTARIFAASVIIADGEIQLRDMETGLPLWTQKGMAGNSPPPFISILEGEPITVDGIVAEIGSGREGIQIDTGEEILTVFGFGPVFYWEQLEVAYPSVGDSISVEAYEVPLDDGTTRIIAAVVSLGDADITLHDLETGLPLWRQERGHGHRPFPFQGENADETEL